MEHRSFYRKAAAQGGDVEEEVADFTAFGIGQHRDQFAETLLERRVGIDVDDRERETERLLQVAERCRHVLAEMAVGPSIEGQGRAAAGLSPCPQGR